MDQKTFKFNSEIYLPKENLQSINTFEKNFQQLENFFSETNKFILLYGDERSGGAVGARWLQSFKGFIEHPVTMLL